MPSMHPESQPRACETHYRTLRCQHAPPTLSSDVVQLHAQDSHHTGLVSKKKPWSPFCKAKVASENGRCMNRGVLLLAFCILSSAPTVRSFATPIQPHRAPSRISCAMSPIRIGIVGTVYPFPIPPPRPAHTCSMLRDSVA